MVTEDFFQALPRMARMVATALLHVAAPVIRDFLELRSLQQSLEAKWGYAAACRKRLQESFRTEMTKAGWPEGIHADGSFDSEEASEAPFTWIMPEIDGYINFANAFPYFCLTTGVVREGRVITSVIYECMSQNIFWADEDYGAFLHPQKALHVSPQKWLKKTLQATGDPVATPTFRHIMQFLARSGVTSRMMGAPVLDMAYVAMANYDLFVGGIGALPLMTSIGELMVKKAKGCTGIQDQVLLAGNAMLLRQIQEHLTAQKTGERRLSSVS